MQYDQLDFSWAGELEFVFQSCPSCVAIEYNLHDYLLALCILYAIGVLVCLVVLAALCILKFSEHQSDDQDTEVRVANNCRNSHRKWNNTHSAIHAGVESGADKS